MYYCTPAIERHLASEIEEDICDELSVELCDSCLAIDGSNGMDHCDSLISGHITMVDVFKKYILPGGIQ